MQAADQDLEGLEISSVCDAALRVDLRVFCLEWGMYGSVRAVRCAAWWDGEAKATWRGVYLLAAIGDVFLHLRKKVLLSGLANFESKNLFIKTSYLKDYNCKCNF